jgi:hypothetical protein
VTARSPWMSAGARCTCLQRKGKQIPSKVQKEVTAVRASSPRNSSVARKPSAEKVAATLAAAAAAQFPATIKAQERLLAQLLPAMAAREELLAASASEPPAVPEPPRTAGPA